MGGGGGGGGALGCAWLRHRRCKRVPPYRVVIPRRCQHHRGAHRASGGGREPSRPLPGPAAAAGSSLVRSARRWVRHSPLGARSPVARALSEQSGQASTQQGTKFQVQQHFRCASVLEALVAAAADRLAAAPCDGRRHLSEHSALQHAEACMPFERCTDDPLNQVTGPAQAARTIATCHPRHRCAAARLAPPAVDPNRASACSPAPLATF